MENGRVIKRDWGFEVYEGTEPYGFISYKRDDSDAVSKYARALSDMGVNLWYDYGIPPGDEWQKIISGRVINASFVALFVTKKIFQSDPIYAEYNVAKSYGVPIIPVFMEEIKPEDVVNGDFALFYSTLINTNGFNAFDIGLEKTVEGLYRFAQSKMQSNSSNEKERRKRQLREIAAMVEALCDTEQSLLCQKKTILHLMEKIDGLGEPVSIEKPNEPKKPQFPEKPIYPQKPIYPEKRQPVKSAYPPSLESALKSEYEENFPKEKDYPSEPEQEKYQFFVKSTDAFCRDIFLLICLLTNSGIVTFFGVYFAMGKSFVKIWSDLGVLPVVAFWLGILLVITEVFYILSDKWYKEETREIAHHTYLYRFYASDDEIINVSLIIFLVVSVLSLIASTIGLGWLHGFLVMIAIIVVAVLITFAEAIFLETFYNSSFCINITLIIPILLILCPLLAFPFKFTIYLIRRHRKKKGHKAEVKRMQELYQQQVKRYNDDYHARVQQEKKYYDQQVKRIDDEYLAQVEKEEEYYQQRVKQMDDEYYAEVQKAETDHRQAVQHMKDDYSAAISQYQQELNNYHENLHQDQLRVQSENNQINAINFIIEQIHLKYAETESSLKELYNKSAFNVSYRHMIPMGCMYELLETGVCNRLDTEDGLYYRVRRELNNEQIFAETDDIITNFDKLVNSEKIMHYQINKQFQRAEKMADDTASLIFQKVSHDTPPSEFDNILASSPVGAYISERRAREQEYLTSPIFQ